MRRRAHVSATNKDLAAAMESGQFRSDLFYRLNVVPIHVPPLRERRMDIGLLARFFLETFCRAEGKPAKDLHPEALAVLEEYRWPGNVRELRNLMERRHHGRGPGVRARTWRRARVGGRAGSGRRLPRDRAREAEAIRRALETANWNVTQAAAGLGIDRTNLHRKMRKYGIARR